MRQFKEILKCIIYRALERHYVPQFRFRTECSLTIVTNKCRTNNERLHLIAAFICHLELQFSGSLINYSIFYMAVGREADEGKLISQYLIARQVHSLAGLFPLPGRSRILILMEILSIHVVKPLPFYLSPFHRHFM